MSYGNAAQNAPAATAETPIAAAVRTIVANQSEAFDALNQLEDRLVHVLQVEQNKTGTPADPGTSCSPLHGELNTIAERAKGVEYRIRSIIARLTL